MLEVKFTVQQSMQRSTGNDILSFKPTIGKIGIFVDIILVVPKFFYSFPRLYFFKLGAQDYNIAQPLITFLLRYN